jgi:UDP-N-acetylmuramoyl-L-alanyl-D-glutamate--2,6-diaminopimelate ligase
VVIDVPTGEILAMVNQPAYNPNARGAAEPGTHRNRAATDVVEPGSVIKPFTVAAALEAGVDPNIIVDTNPGWMMLGKYRISDVHNHGAVDLTHLLSTFLQRRRGQARPRDDQRAPVRRAASLRLRRQLALGLSRRVSGVMAPPQTWGMVKRGSISYGMGVSVTPLQLAQAYATLANHGKRMPPTFLKGGAGEPVQAMSPKIAHEVMAMLEKRHAARRHRAEGGDHRLPRRRQDRHRAHRQRRRLLAQVRVGVRRRGADGPAEVRDGGGDQPAQQWRLLRRHGLRAGVPQRHGRRAAPDGRAAGPRRTVVRGQARAARGRVRVRCAGLARARACTCDAGHRGAGRGRRGGPVSRAMSLQQLLAGEAVDLPAGFDPLLTGLSIDSRALNEGDAFIALAGATTHGLRFLEQARAAKVAAVLFEPPAPAGTALPEDAVAVEGLRGKLGRLADRFYDAPSRHMQVTGVTGTNGKTSTVQLIAQALSLHGERAGTIGTLGAGLYGRHVAGERTTPDVIAGAPPARAAARGRRHARGDGSVLARARPGPRGRGRVQGGGVHQPHARPPRLPRQHDRVRPGEGAPVRLADAARGGDQPRRCLRPAALRCRARRRAPHRPELARSAGREPGSAGAAAVAGRACTSACRSGEAYDVASPLLGRFNIDNLLAVAGTLRALDWSLEDVAAVLPRLSPVDGRMSRAGGHDGLPLVVVDYAHTPDALEQALASLREHTPGA